MRQRRGLDSGSRGSASLTTKLGTQQDAADELLALIGGAQANNEGEGVYGPGWHGEHDSRPAGFCLGSRPVREGLRFKRGMSWEISEGAGWEENVSIVRFTNPYQIDLRDAEWRATDALQRTEAHFSRRNLHWFSVVYGWHSSALESFLPCHAQATTNCTLTSTLA